MAWWESSIGFFSMPKCHHESQITGIFRRNKRYVHMVAAGVRLNKLLQRMFTLTKFESANDQFPIPKAKQSSNHYFSGVLSFSIDFCRRYIMFVKLAYKRSPLDRLDAKNKTTAKGIRLLLRSCESCNT